MTVLQDQRGHKPEVVYCTPGRSRESTLANRDTSVKAPRDASPIDVHPPTMPSPDVLQVFWETGAGFVERESVTTPIVADGEVRRYTLRLPGTARGPLRLDPGGRPAYGEIHRIELVALDGEDGETGRTLRCWSAADGDAPPFPANGATCLPGRTTYRFICTHDNPQLLLDGVPERRDANPWLLRLTLSLSARVIDVLADEVDRLEGLRANQHQRLLESAAVRETAEARSLGHERTARRLADQLEEQARAFDETEARGRGECERLLAQVAEHERAAATRSEAVSSALERITSLEARAVEQEKSAAAWRAERIRRQQQLAARDETIRSLRAKGESLSARLTEVEAQLGARTFHLDRIARSRGWRWLNGFRTVKHRLLDPLRRLGARCWDLVRGQCSPTLEPLEGLRWVPEHGVWHATGRDPQFNVAPPWPLGWVEISLHVELNGPAQGEARLYADGGAGYSERRSYGLGHLGIPQRRLVWLPPDTTGLRLDPFEAPGYFVITSLTFRRVAAGRGSPDAALASASGTERALVSDTAKPDPGADLATIDPYEAWLDVNRWNERRAALLAQRLALLTDPPLFSVLMPVYDPDPAFLDRAIASVAGQVYPHWELCVADDAGTDPEVGETLRRWAARDPRVRVVWRKARGHISRATNSAAEIARGEFLAFLDHDDELTPDALGEMALHVAEHPQVDLLYSDDDKINAEGDRFAPHFKPDWSPELLLSYMYLSHLFVVRRTRYIEVGGLREGYEGSQDYDLALRVTAITGQVGHVPKILYHWRAVPGSTAISGAAKPESFEAGRRAVQEALDRRGIAARAYHPKWALEAGCGMFSHQFPDHGPRVAIIIPTRNNLTLLKTCLESLAKTTYRNYEVIVVDNGDEDPGALDVLRDTPGRVVRMANPDGVFSFAAINNRAVERVDAELVLFLNDDTQVVARGWLSQMVGYLGVPGVGAVGARLRFPDGRLQHAGIVHGYYHGLAGPAFKLLSVSAQGYMSYTKVTRNYSAVTAACLLTRRELFQRLGGFDETDFAVAYNDVDYCYRLGAAGHRVVYCPTAELVHHEGASRGSGDHPAEPAAFRRRYGTRHDPFYNPNLSLRDERFAVQARTLAPPRLPPIRTLMCSHSLDWDGAPYSQLELTVGLRAAGVIDPVVYSPDDGPLRDAYEAHGIRVEVFEHPLTNADTSATYEAALDRFTAWFDTLGVELVYGNTRNTFYAIAAAHRRGVPSIWNQRESEPWRTYFDQFGPDVARHALRCFAYPYKVVFVADATRDSCAELDTRRNFVTIHNGLHRGRFAAALGRWPRELARRELGVAPADVVCLTVGTVCERKGQLDLVQAIGRLGEAAAAAIRCFIVGDRANEYSATVEAARDRLPESTRSRITIVPATEDTALYYAAADVFVLSSRIESFPRVILEAMAAGLPIVTTRVYGIGEQVQENVNALCYAPGDVPALAAHLRRLVRDQDLRRGLGDNSPHVLDGLNDFDAMVAAYAEVFREAWLTGTPR